MHVRESGVGVGGNRERNNIIYERQTDRGKRQRANFPYHVSHNSCKDTYYTSF